MSEPEKEMENAHLYQRDKMLPQNIFAMERALSVEEDIRTHIDPFARFPESTFRRQGLPILSGLIDGTFDHNTWVNFVGSGFVPCQVVADDLSKVLFTVPAMLYTGQTLLHVEGQQSLSDESMDIDRYAALMPTAGEKAKHDLIVGTLDGIDKLSYESNRQRGFQVIRLLNWIFERYGLAGRIAYPEGMEDLLNAGAAAVAPAATVKAQPVAEISDAGLDDCADL